MLYDKSDANSIIQFANKLRNLTLRNVLGDDIKDCGIKGKGNFGQILEKYYFGYDLNSKSEPDFPEAGLELKSSPLKVLKNKSIRAKERLVLNIINYLEVHKEDFETSSFWKKNAHLLLVFYLYDKKADILDYVIKLVDEWKYPTEDLKIIKDDWKRIQQKVIDGRAHELSEGDTLYLGACTKGATAAKSLREQPFNKEKAKQRAYSLKAGYVNHILANIAEEERATYGKILNNPIEVTEEKTFEEIVVSRFKPYLGMTDTQINTSFNNVVSTKAKHFHSMLTNLILGIGTKQKVEEFEKANIRVKTVRIKENGMPKEDISFPTFKFEEVIEKDWESSDFKSFLEQKFFFVFYQMSEKRLILKNVKFWNMPYEDLNEAKIVWLETVKTIKSGLIVKSISEKGIRRSFFPNKKDNRVSHVRPHAKNKHDTFPLPIKDKKTGLKDYTKHCFWLNAGYIKNICN